MLNFLYLLWYTNAKNQAVLVSFPSTHVFFKTKKHFQQTMNANSNKRLYAPFVELFIKSKLVIEQLVDC